MDMASEQVGAVRAQTSKNTFLPVPETTDTAILKKPVAMARQRFQY